MEEERSGRSATFSFCIIAESKATEHELQPSVQRSGGKSHRKQIVRKPDVSTPRSNSG